jgi:hypothetical protein
MKFIIEMFWEGECIERRVFDGDDIPKNVPVIGDKLYVEFDNEHYTKEYGAIWEVHDRFWLFFKHGQMLRTLQLYIRPYKPLDHHNFSGNFKYDE